MIWWIWTAFTPHKVHTFPVDPDGEDVAWLGEGAWVFQRDHLGIGLR